MSLRYKKCYTHREKISNLRTQAEGPTRIINAGLSAKVWVIIVFFLTFESVRFRVIFCKTQKLKSIVNQQALNKICVYLTYNLLHKNYMRNPIKLRKFEFFEHPKTRLTEESKCVYMSVSLTRLIIWD